LEILKSEELAIYDQVVNTSASIEEMKTKQEENKKKLLQILSTSDNIIENEEVIKTLQEIQRDYSHIESNREILENEFENFEIKING